jgi:hypothetical protein
MNIHSFMDPNYTPDIAMSSGALMFEMHLSHGCTQYISTLMKPGKAIFYIKNT